MREEDFGICPYVTVQKLLSGKWTLIILFLLAKKTMRFSELQREIPRLTQATLTKQLRTLEKDGLIIRTVYNQIPPKVEYSLSDMGEKFKPVIKSLKDWGDEYIMFSKKRDCTKL
ncbi:winged helix-turn-helix transcriptional regulator [Sporomusa acidovorans]|uniref:HTH-type transcriptional regulator YybR n=1 Tax=Sporomusa acidovorans (strain ATCC 49682 / DSM 3132 / Mol) TaxID=1123286 RepID=A0ABZ3JAM3_SPOA4|nr:helix-turn-helix domain-containing protein [Sporomusa acidovorans]OZC13206.1 putative HTH-type transcriptional regulator YybR [Sporomusa acidovorans DSM 3132]SDE01179.1 transcriptional regulator, HxlR family [Sporomusa acidovorans]